jgi:hypothetical protein
MDEEEWVYAWEDNFVDEDGQLCIITILSTMVLHLYESFHLSPILFPNFLSEIAETRQMLHVFKNGTLLLSF